MPRLPGSAVRIGLIAGYTLRQASRQRVFHAILVLAVALVVGVQWLRELSFGTSELKFVADFGFGAIAFFGAALAIASTAQLFFAEIEQRTVLTLLARPVRRSEFLLGKFAGIAAVLAVFGGVLTASLALVLWSRETALMRAYPDAFGHGRAIDYAALAGAGFAQWLKLSVLAALTLLVASFARTQLFTMVTGFFILVICHLQHFAQHAAARGGSLWSRGAAWLLATAFPDFQTFDFSESVGAGDGISAGTLAGVSGYGIAYAAAVCALAIFSFNRREL